MTNTLDQVALLQGKANNNKMSSTEALELCDALPVVDIDAIIGKWHGTEITTGHPMDGMLAKFGWYGKQFIDRNNVHPLLFSDQHGALFALNPQWLPLNLALKWPFLQKLLPSQAVRATRFIFQTHQSKARVRMLEYRGKVSATMIYDNLPIYDTFRLIDQDTLLGVMDFKRTEQPFIFKLHRDK